jgi:hypothetical protein
MTGIGYYMLPSIKDLWWASPIRRDGRWYLRLVVNGRYGWLGDGPTYMEALQALMANVASVAAQSGRQGNRGRYRNRWLIAQALGASEWMKAATTTSSAPAPASVPVPVLRAEAIHGYVM